MPWEAWFMLGLVVMLVVALARSWAGPDLIMLGGLALLMGVGAATRSGRLPTAGDLVEGFGSSGPITVGVLFVVVAGLVRTGAMTMLTQPLLGRPKTTIGAQLRLLPPVAVLSGFLNNTPIVAMFLPVVDDWSRKCGLSASRLLIPLSYAAILGGTCTLVGTSTNLIVNGLMVSRARLPSMGMFELAAVGLPVAAVGMAYILLASRTLLKDRRRPIAAGDDPRQYTVEMVVEPGGALVGKTIAAAGLRHLPGLYLAEIERAGEVLPAVAPNEKLRDGDQLVFVGVVESVIDLQKIRGLSPATNQLFKLNAPRSKRCLVEAVVSDECPLVNKTIRDGRFRSAYGAVVIAVARKGQRIRAKIGDIVLRPGDLLLLEADASFPERLRGSRDFYLASRLEDTTPVRHDRVWAALAILAFMVVSVAVGALSMLAAAMLAAGMMILARCCSGADARRSVNWHLLLIIGAAIGIGRAIDSSGLALTLATRLIALAGGNPWLVLAVVYGLTTLFTELITNNAAAVLIFPIALSAATALDVSFKPFAMAICIAASASFATPIGYQTNLMVYAAGGYRFSDFLRFGLPLNLIVMAVTVALAPCIWPFQAA